jgi:hyperosmotically inducible protein
MKTKFLIMTIGLISLAFAGCESTGNTNTNLRNTNTNTGYVTNNNTATPAATPRRDNSNISKEEYEKNRADYEKDKGSSTIGQGVNDSWIWFKTKTALATTADLRDSTINVDVVNDVITLKGTVANAEQKTKAEAVAKGIDGQKGVKNELKVAPKDSMTNQAINGKSTPTPAANVNKK